jgi:hypothetical protein
VMILRGSKGAVFFFVAIWLVASIFFWGSSFTRIFVHWVNTKYLCLIHTFFIVKWRFDVRLSAVSTYGHVLYATHFGSLILKVDKASYFLKLRRWWKGIDIFKKAYILFPVHAE